MATYLRRVSAKRLDMFLHPRNSGKLVLQTEVHHAKLPCLCALWEAERPNAVVETDVDDRCPLDHGQSKQQHPLDTDLNLP